MGHEKSDIVLMAVEDERGTAETTFPLHQPFITHLVPNLTNEAARIMSSGTHPHVSALVPMGAEASLTLGPDLNVNTIRDLLLLLTKRTAGLLPAVTIAHSQVGMAPARYTGSVAKSLVMEFSRASGDGGGLLTGTMEFGVTLPEQAGSVAAGTQATGRYFALRSSTLKVNNVAATRILSAQISCTINMSEGKPGDSSNQRLWLEEGAETWQFAYTAHFAAADWRAAIEAGTDMVTSDVTLATGTANETVSLALAKARMASWTLGQQDGTLTEQVVIRPYYGSAAAVAVTFGSAIGASVLGL